MNEDQLRHVEQQIPNLEANVRFMSQAGRPERERLSCAMFLRALGVRFSSEQLIAIPEDGAPEYVDVKFDDARFQVTEKIEENWHRQHVMNARLQRYKHAVEHWRTTCFRDVIAPPHRPEWSTMAYDEVYHQVSDALKEKALQYKPPACARLDALVDFHLHGVSPDLASPLPDDAALRQQGWRSVSFTMAMCSHVVYATDAAPAFLQTSVGQTRRYLGDPYAFYQL